MSDAVESRELRSARVAHVLARAVREEEVAAADVLRILRHELRRKNTNKKEAIATRSVGAQRVIDQYGTGSVRKNSSPDALHADHVYPLTEATLKETATVEAWVCELRRISLVVCVTAEENYRLMNVEAAGLTGPAKYAKAGVKFITDELPWSDR